MMEENKGWKNGSFQKWITLSVSSTCPAYLFWGYHVILSSMK
jgi:hypothetical protein